MDEVVRRALETLARENEAEIAGLGTFTRIEGRSRSIEYPSPLAGAASKTTTLPARHRLRFERGDELDAIIASGELPADLDAPAVVRDALETLVREGEATIAGLGTLHREIEPVQKVRIPNPMTGEKIEVERGGPRLRFVHSAALDDVVAGKPIPELVPDAVVAPILEAYPPDAAWSLELLLEHLARGGRRRAHPSARSELGPPLFSELARSVDEMLARRARPMLAEGHADAAKPSLCEVLRDGNGDRWVAAREGDDPRTYFVEHEGGDHLTETGPLSRLLAAWLFHDEVVATIGDGIVSTRSRRALEDRFAALCEPAARFRGSFARFRA